ncbi:MAG: tetratricopeptide repeat protein [Opitutae bacterium]|mgnify:FL=1|jgi:TolA-binding protein|nr:tetratricopeptide repeat protein [Opitutae bacterium]MBT5910703.1 tetratricopeptide repeat protein [Opitutae bacterium]
MNALRFLTSTVLVVLCCTLPAGSLSAQEAKEPRGRSRASGGLDRQAKHLFDKALELMEYKQFERGIDMLNTVIRDYQGSVLSYRAHMALGKHYQDKNKFKDSLNHFILLTRLLAPVAGEKQEEEMKELYHESLFQSGFSNFKSGQYGACFSYFRRLTEVAGKTKWANQAYYYIGMSHYNLKNWNKAISALELVGTEIEEVSGDEMGRVEIGARFYAKITDADVPVLRKIGQPVRAEVKVSSGDKEIMNGVPMPGKPHEMLASLPTQLGRAQPGDGKLQMIGGDTLEVTYLDDSTLGGEKGIARTGKVQAVSTGTVGFFLGDYSTPAYVAYPGLPQVVILRDADLDKSDKPETITLRVSSRYKIQSDGSDEVDDVLELLSLQDKEEEVWKERDGVEIQLVEQILKKEPLEDANSTTDTPTPVASSVRTGVFVGKINLEPMDQGTLPDDSDAVLNAAELDELIVSYLDDVHVYGEDSRESTATIKVSGSVKSDPTADTFEVFEIILRARKGRVEAEALAGLGQIYKDMGLDARATEKAKDALTRVNPIIIDRLKLPGELVEKAFSLKWECELLMDDFDSASATCRAFNRLYPESILADQALMTLGKSLAENGEHDQAVSTYKLVLELKNPISAAEAQFRIGVALEAKAKEIAQAQEGAANSKWSEKGSTLTPLQRLMGNAIFAYRATFQRYPESSYATEALGRVVRHYVETENFSLAATLLENVFTEYPDASFLDEMLMHWFKVAYRMGDKATAKAKLDQLIFDYPTSPYVSEARKRLSGLSKEVQ